MKKTLFFTLFCLILNACKDDSSNNAAAVGDEFIFTKYYCYCSGNCISGYKLTSEGLFKGAGAHCDPATLAFSTSSLPDDKVGLGQILLYEIPGQMLDSAKETYGCPDCGDWGGYYIQMTTGDVTRSWRLDTHKDSLPGDIKAYVETLGQIMADLQ